MALDPFRLSPFFSPRVWGFDDLSRWYPGLAFAEPIGEAWLTGPQCIAETGPEQGKSLSEIAAEHAPELLGSALLGPASSDDAEAARDFPLLTKLLFPRDKLSVQVHPDDAMAQSLGEARGKTECWYVLEAEPGAAVALGLKPGTSSQDVEQAIRNLTLERRLQWLPVSAGDMIFVDPGTVHAIGNGVVLFEVQQSSDLTYRLYDYGRPRELHTELGLRATRLETAAGKVAAQINGETTTLIEQEYFIVERLALGAGVTRHFPRPENSPRVPLILVPDVAGAVLTSGSGESVEMKAWHAVIVPATTLEFSITTLSKTTVLTARPGAA